MSQHKPCVFDGIPTFNYSATANLLFVSFASQLRPLRLSFPHHPPPTSGPFGNPGGGWCGHQAAPASSSRWNKARAPRPGRSFSTMITGLHCCSEFQEQVLGPMEPRPLPTPLHRRLAPLRPQRPDFCLALHLRVPWSQHCDYIPVASVWPLLKSFLFVSCPWATAQSHPDRASRANSHL